MTVARSAGDVLSDHIVFEIESIHRMYRNVWVPRLAYGAGVQGFCVGHRGHHYDLHRADGPDDQGLRRRHRTASSPREAWNWRPSVRNARTMWPSSSWPGSPARGRAVRRAGAGEGTGVAHPAPLQPGRGAAMPGWYARRRSSTTSTSVASMRISAPFFSQVQHLLPLHRRTVQVNGKRIRRTPGGQGRHAGPRRSTTGLPRSTTVLGCRRSGDESGTRADPNALLREWLAILPSPFTDDAEAAGYR